MKYNAIITAAVMTTVLFAQAVFTSVEPLASLRLVAGIPYGSISGRVAEYFATQRTTTSSDDDIDDIDKSNNELDSIGKSHDLDV